MAHEKSSFHCEQRERERETISDAHLLLFLYIVHRWFIKISENNNKRKMKRGQRQKENYAFVII